MKTAATSDVQDVLTSHQAAKLLRIHVDSVTRLSREGKLPCGPVGQRWRYSRQALLQWVSRTDGVGQIKRTRRLVDFPPAELIERLRQRGGELVLEDGKLQMKGLTMAQVPRALSAAIKSNITAIKEELERRHASAALYQKAERELAKAQAARGGLG